MASNAPGFLYYICGGQVCKKHIQSSEYSVPLSGVMIVLVYSIVVGVGQVTQDRFRVVASNAPGFLYYICGGQVCKKHIQSSEYSVPLSGVMIVLVYSIVVGVGQVTQDRFRVVSCPTVCGDNCTMCVQSVWEQRLYKQIPCLTLSPGVAVGRWYLTAFRPCRQLRCLHH